jgi:hypothetical protein
VLARARGAGGAQLALSAGTIYWTEGATGRVMSLPVTSPGGTPTVVADDQQLPTLISADDTAVYWTNEGDLSIMRAPLAGTPDAGAAVDAGVPAPLLVAPAIVNGLLASAGTLYYAAGPSTFKVAGTGGAPTTLATFAACRPTQPAGLALDTDHLYQTDFLQQFLSRERIDGTQLGKDPCAAADAGAPQVPVPDTISHSQGELLFDALAVVDGQIVWADFANITAKPVDGTTATSGHRITSTVGGNAVTGFVVSDGNVYIGEGDGSGNPGGDAIEVAPLDPGEGGSNEAQVLAVGQPNPARFVADATHIYFVTCAPSATPGLDDDCAIMSLAK